MSRIENMYIYMQYLLSKSQKVIDAAGDDLVMILIPHNFHGNFMLYALITKK